MKFEKLWELFLDGSDDSCLQRGKFVESWRETEIGLVKACKEVGTGEVQYLQIVGETMVYFPD